MLWEPSDHIQHNPISLHVIEFIAAKGQLALYVVHEHASIIIIKDHCTISM